MKKKPITLGTFREMVQEAFSPLSDDAEIKIEHRGIGDDCLTATDNDGAFSSIGLIVTCLRGLMGTPITFKSLLKTLNEVNNRISSDAKVKVRKVGQEYWLIIEGDTKSDGARICLTHTYFPQPLDRGMGLGAA